MVRRQFFRVLSIVPAANRIESEAASGVPQRDGRDAHCAGQGGFRHLRSRSDDQRLSPHTAARSGTSRRLDAGKAFELLHGEVAKSWRDAFIAREIDNGCGRVTNTTCGAKRKVDGFADKIPAQVGVTATIAVKMP